MKWLIIWVIMVNLNYLLRMPLLRIDKSKNVLFSQNFNLYGQRLPTVQAHIGCEPTRKYEKLTILKCHPLG